jgi:hypothetical protein
MSILDAAWEANPTANAPIAGLYMWAHASREAEARALRALLDSAFPSPLSYGPRYQLLLFELLDSMGDVSLSEAVAIRRRALNVR